MKKTCIDCENRHPGCQNVETCEIYRKMIEKNQAIKKSRKKYQMFDDLKISSIVRVQDYKRKGRSTKEE